MAEIKKAAFAGFLENHEKHAGNTVKLIGKSLPILLLIAGAFAQESGRAGIHFGAGVSPELSCQLVSTYTEGSHATFLKTLGALGTDLQLAFSKSGKNIHSMHAAIAWDFPTERFLGSIVSGYSFGHYFDSDAPSPAFGFETNTHFRLNEMNENRYIPGTQFGIKFGYETRRHVTCWLGYVISFEIYSYSYDKIWIETADLSNTIREIGKVTANEFVIANRFQILLQYLFY
jgi:hypothetical protein